MREDLRDVIATDIPRVYAAPETAPLEIDDDLTHRDAWMFVLVIAAAVILPAIAALLFGLSVWHVFNDGPTLSLTQPTTFASRWPSREMPLIVVR